MGGVSESKIQKVGAANFDDLSVWNAILASPQTKIEKFDELKNNPRVWIGQLEYSIVAVGGAIETHGLGVLPFGLQKESEKWLLKFDSENENATWTACKENFIKHFEEAFGKRLEQLYEKRKNTECIEEYAKTNKQRWNWPKSCFRA